MPRLGRAGSRVPPRLQRGAHPAQTARTSSRPSPPRSRPRSCSARRAQPAPAPRAGSGPGSAAAGPARPPVAGRPAPTSPWVGASPRRCTTEWPPRPGPRRPVCAAPRGQRSGGELRGGGPVRKAALGAAAPGTRHEPAAPPLRPLLPQPLVGCVTWPGDPPPLWGHPLSISVMGSQP